MNNQKSEKNKSEIIRAIIVLIIILMIGIVSILIYLLINKNAILTYEENKENKETSTGPKNVIENEYTKVELSKLYYYNSSLIFEYHIDIKDVDHNTGLEEDYEEDVDEEDSIELNGKIYVNGKNIENYSTQIEKISNSEYKIYHKIDVGNTTSNLKIIMEIDELLYNQTNIGFDDDYCFFVAATTANSESDNGTDVNLKNNLTINSIYVDTSYSNLYEEYSLVIYEENELNNPYYTANAPRISLADFQINGLKLEMSLDDAIEILQKSYDDKKINIYCKNNLSKIKDMAVRYSDDYIQLLFYNNSNGGYQLREIELIDTKVWKEYGAKEEDFVKKYYSEGKFTVLSKGSYEYKLLYGKEYVEYVINGDYLKGDFAYILTQDNEDALIVYYDNGINLYIKIDSETKLITSIEISYYSS